MIHSLLLFAILLQNPSLDSVSPKEREAAVEKMAFLGNSAAIPQLAEALKKESKSGGVSEEDVEKAEAEVQKLTDQYIGKIDAHLAAKEKEILTV